MKPEDLRERDQRQLKELFYRNFDRSRLEAMIRLPDARLDRDETFLGEGHHFRAWRIKPMTPGQPCLVLKRAGRTMGEALGPARRQWLEAMGRLKGAGGLVPPFELLEVDGHVGLVMPYGDRALTEASGHWQPMAARLAELDACLAAKGLVLADIPQGRCLGGVPFLYDLSDVREASTSPDGR